MTTNPTIRFTSPHQVTVVNQPLPPLQPGQALVRTTHSLISTGTELTMLSGDVPIGSVWARIADYPLTPGYSNCGVVAQVGDPADETWLGQRVFTFGVHARYHAAPLERLYPVPDAIPDEAVTLAAIAEIVMNGVRRGGIQWGEAVVIHGAGLLGQFAARFCRMVGARPVVVSDIAAQRLALLPHDPALHAVNPNQSDLAAVVRALTDGRMADAAFELTGNAALIPSEFEALRRQGRLIILSSPRGVTPFDFHDLCNAPSYTIIGVHNQSHPPVATPDNPWTIARNVQFYFELLADSELDVSPLISHRATYDQAPALYAMLEADRSQAMGVLMRWPEIA